MTVAGGYEADLVVKIVRPPHRGCNYAAKIISLIDLETGKPASIETRMFQESFGFTTSEAIQSLVDHLDQELAASILNRNF